MTTTSYSQITASTTVTEPGYAFVYVSNENPVIQDVWFDDVVISYTPTRVLQHNDFYAFGMQSRDSWIRPGSSNNFLYNQGSEINTSTALYDLPFRNYDATLGRFFQVDPYAMSYHDKSVYQYVSNNPVMMNDPTGGTQNSSPTGSTNMFNFGVASISPYDLYRVWAENISLSPAYNNYNSGTEWLRGGQTQKDYKFYTPAELKWAIERGDKDAANYAAGKYGGIAISVSSENGGKFYPTKDIGQGLKDMWAASTGKNKVENMAIFISGGMIVLPNTGNTARSSAGSIAFLMETLNLTAGTIEWDGEVYGVLGMVHTHPNNYPGDPEGHTPNDQSEGEWYWRDRQIGNYVISADGVYKATSTGEPVSKFFGRLDDKTFEKIIKLF